MEEESVSMVLSDGANVIEVSDSNSSNAPSAIRKRMRCNGNNSVPSQFKGVVPQPNGHWGSQIYANHQRIWLGTFKSETEAAMAYDSAAIKLRSGENAHRNFPFTNITMEEPKFQRSYSTEAVLNMIRDGTYPSRFYEFLRNKHLSAEAELNKRIDARCYRKYLCTQLFEKQLTPSDVGKLNRLVIPKKYATRFFPIIPRSNQENGDVVQLAFYDRSMALWVFQYCYWSSSQSYVFTRGWNRFVREMQLRPNDSLGFFLCECRENEVVTRTFFMIDTHGKYSAAAEKVAMEVELQRRLDSIAAESDDIKNVEMVDQQPVIRAEKKGFKLFGTSIIQ